MSYEKDIEGDWIFPDHDKLELFEEISINAKFPDDKKQNLIQGYITSINVHIDESEAESYIEIHGMDSTVLMDLEEKKETYTDKSDSDIAQEIFGNYGFSVNLDATDPPPTGFTRTQRGTDIQFLKELAAKMALNALLTLLLPVEVLAVTSKNLVWMNPHKTHYIFILALKQISLAGHLFRWCTSIIF